MVGMGGVSLGLPVWVELQFSHRFHVVFLFFVSSRLGPLLSLISITGCKEAEQMFTLQLSGENWTILTVNYIICGKALEPFTSKPKSIPNICH